MSYRNKEDQPENLEASEFYLFKLLGIISQYLLDNPELLQLTIPVTRESLGMQRTDSSFFILQEMGRYMPIRKIVIQKRTATSPGVSIKIGAAPAGSPHTMWVIPYDTFIATHSLNIQDYLADINSTHPAEATSSIHVETELCEEFKNKQYYSFSPNFKGQFRLPIHSCVWAYIEIEDVVTGNTQLLEFDLYDLIGSKSRGENPLKQLHLSETVLAEVYKAVMSEVEKQLDYLAQLYSEMYNSYLAPQMLELLTLAYEKKLILTKPVLKDIYVSKQELLKIAALGHDSQLEYANSRGPQSNQALHFHLYIPTFRRRFVKLVTGRDDLIMNADEQTRFNELMNMFAGLEITSGKMSYLKTEEMTTRSLAKHIDIHGSIYSELLIKKLVSTIRNLVKKAVPGKEVSINHFHSQSHKSTNQALSTAGWRITIKDCAAESALQSLQPVLYKWYQDQLEVFNLYLDYYRQVPKLEIDQQTVGQHLHVEQNSELETVYNSLKTILPQTILKEVAEIFMGLKPTEAMLRDLSENDNRNRAALHLQNMELRKLRRAIISDIQAEFMQHTPVYEELLNGVYFEKHFKRNNALRIKVLQFVGERLRKQLTRTSKLNNRQLNAIVEKYLKEDNSKELATQVLMSLTKGVYSSMNSDIPAHKQLIKKLLSFLVNEQYLSSPRSANAMRIPGFILTWQELAQPDDTVNTVIRLSPCINERGPLETIFGISIIREEPAKK